MPNGIPGCNMQNVYASYLYLQKNTLYLCITPIFSNYQVLKQTEGYPFLGSIRLTSRVL